MQGHATIGRTVDAKTLIDAATQAQNTRATTISVHLPYLLAARPRKINAGCLSACVPDSARVSDSQECGDQAGDHGVRSAATR